MSQLHSALNRAIESHDALRRFTRSVSKQQETVEIPDLFDSIHKILEERNWTGLMLPEEDHGAYNRLDHAVKGVLARHLASTSGLTFVPVLARVGNIAYGHSRRTATRHFQTTFEKFGDELREHHVKLFDGYSRLLGSLREHSEQRMNAASTPEMTKREIYVYRKILSGLTELDTLLDHFIFHLNDPTLMREWMNARHLQ